jgi:hypothetical protein
MKNASPIESNLDMNQSKTDANCARRNPVVTNQDKQGSLSFFTRCFDRLVGRCWTLWFRGSYLEYDLSSIIYLQHKHEQRDH